MGSESVAGVLEGGGAENRCLHDGANAQGLDEVGDGGRVGLRAQVAAGDGVGGQPVRKVIHSVSCAERLSRTAPGRALNSKLALAKKQPPGSRSAS